MSKALIYFDGTNVLLIPEQYVPTKPKISEGNFMRVSEYNAALEVAKKSAIRVGNADCREIHPSGKWNLRLNDNSVISLNHAIASLPDGYLYETECRCKKCGIPDYEVNSCKAQEDCEEINERVAIIIPVSKPDTSETTLSALRNKLSPVFNLIAIVSESDYKGPLKDYLDKCDMPAIKELLSKLEPEQSEDELWSGVEKILWDKRHSVSDTLQELQSKYTITKRTP